jgi:acetyl esterase/lipase
MSSDSALVPEGTRERIAASVLRMGVRIALRPALAPHVPLRWQRWWLRQLARTTATARGIARQSAIIGGIAGEWLRPEWSAAAGASILYLHGGGYCVGSPVTHRALTSRLARAAGIPVFAAAYRLAPEHPFPAAAEDAIAAYRGLAQIGPVVIAGDSEGACLALMAALEARRRKIRTPAALVLFSPWVDLAALPDKPAKGEVMLSNAWLRACTARYLAGGDAAAPPASLLHEDLRGLPPTLIQAGADELLLSDTIKLRGALEKAGVAVRCEIVPLRWHAFQLHAGWLPSADAALARAAQFISEFLIQSRGTR